MMARSLPEAVAAGQCHNWGEHGAGMLAKLLLFASRSAANRVCCMLCFFKAGAEDANTIPAHSIPTTKIEATFTGGLFES